MKFQHSHNKQYFFLIFFLFFSCSKEEIDMFMKYPELEYLFGEWEWFASVSPWSGDTTKTPLSAGYTLQLEMNKTSELNSGDFRESLDNDPGRTLTFKLVEATTDEWPIKYYIDFDQDFIAKKIYYLTPDTIALLSNYDGADIAYYVRK